MTGKDTVDAHPEPNNHNDDRIRYIQFSDRMFKPPHPEQEPEYIITEHQLFLFGSNGFFDSGERREMYDAVHSRPHLISPSHTVELYRLYKEAYDNSYMEALDDNGQLEDEPQVVIGLQKLREIICSHLSETEIFAYGLDCSQGAECKSCKEDPEKCGMRMRDGSPASFKPLTQDLRKKDGE